MPDGSTIGPASLAVNTTGASSGVAIAKDIKGFDNLSGMEDAHIALGFVDRSAADFTLRPDARLLKEVPSFEKIPFGNIGLFEDKHRTKLPMSD